MAAERSMRSKQQKESFTRSNDMDRVEQLLKEFVNGQSDSTKALKEKQAAQWAFVLYDDIKTQQDLLEKAKFINISSCRIFHLPAVI